MAHDKQRAPNFDLSSTEDVLLMLRDEVPRGPVVLYFFADPASEATRSDLTALAGRSEALEAVRARVLGVSPAKLPALKTVQRELGLPFPLLYDDRGFSAEYGVGKPEEGDAPPALFVVGRDQTILWSANPLTGIEQALTEAERVLKPQPPTSAAYPRSVVNRLIDRFVS